MSRVLRRLGFWILVPDTRRYRWDDRATRPSFGARSSTCSQTGEASPAWRIDLDISAQTIYNWRRQDRIDRGLQPGLSTAEAGELTAAKKRIADLETELAVSRRAVELLKGEANPKGGTRRPR